MRELQIIKEALNELSYFSEHGAPQWINENPIQERIDEALTAIQTIQDRLDSKELVEKVTDALESMHVTNYKSRAVAAIKAIKESE